MLPDKCDSYDPNLAVLKIVYWLEWAHISHKVHKEEYIHSGYVWVYSTESKINISEFFLQLEGIRKENYIIAEKKKSTRTGKLIVKIEETKKLSGETTPFTISILNGHSSPPSQKKAALGEIRFYLT